MVASHGEDVACASTHYRTMWRDEDDGLDMAEYRATVKPASHFLSWSETFGKGVASVKQVSSSLFSAATESVKQVSSSLFSAAKRRRQEVEECEEEAENENETPYGKQDTGSADDLGCGGHGSKVRRVGNDLKSSYRKHS